MYPAQRADEWRHYLLVIGGGFGNCFHGRVGNSLLALATPTVIQIGCLLVRQNQYVIIAIDNDNE
jgi:hypothetical protein